MSYPTTLKAALAESDVLYTREQIDAAIAGIAKAIDADMGDECPVFLTVMHGALIFAGQLALALSCELEFDYLHATRYRGETSGGELHWLRTPQLSLQDRTVLLVDDILDEGHTLKAVRDDCLARGAKRVLIVTLCTKLHDRCVAGMHSDYNGIELPDRYVFGYGMDYQERGRNLPAIYALK